MGRWGKAEAGDVCSECGDTFDGGEDAYASGHDTYCEGCYEELSEGEGSFGDDDDFSEAGAFLIDGVGFADPGGRSSLRAETPDNPRDCDCPTCGRENVLTRIDRQRGYQCDRCADAAEGHGY